MAIQHRRGQDKDFDIDKMLPGEIAITTDGTRKIYVCFSVGDIQNLMEVLGGSGNITIDSVLSNTSANPVQNKVIAAELEKKVNSPSSAETGQYLRIKSVDSNGKPMEFEATFLEDGLYKWAKYEAVGQSSGEITETEYEKKTFNTLSPSARILFKSAAYDSTQGRIVLSDPYSTEKLSGADQKNYYSEYPYFYGDYENGQTDNTVYKYVSLSQGSGGVVNGWSWTINKLELADISYTKGEYIGTVYAETETAYPDDGVQGGYWYVLQRTQASNVSFDNADTGLASTNVQDAIKEIIGYINEDLLGGAS